MAQVPYIWFRGFRMTPNYRDAILAAEGRAGFRFRLTQGGHNNGAVAASAGTHDGDADDGSIKEPTGKRMSRAKVAKMIEARRWAGIATWLRTAWRELWGVRAQGFGSEHTHSVPNGWGAPSRGARTQAVRYRQGRDALARNFPDIGPGHTKAWYNRTTPGKPYSPPVRLPIAPKPSPGNGTTAPKGRPFSLGNVVNTARVGGRHGNVTTVQTYLNREYLNHRQGRMPVDGHYGPVTKRVYAGWQRYLGYKGKGADGIPGRASLSRLFKNDYYIV